MDRGRTNEDRTKKDPRTENDKENGPFEGYFFQSTDQGNGESLEMRLQGISAPEETGWVYFGVYHTGQYGIWDRTKCRSNENSGGQ